ncbi:UNKNOWN [Stylonychia lemnae]|uniref:BOS complex subunit TMEM147 n=1 Tax=Stylonychia lemnae TaxID=5949 RepID=A0A077ZTT2_STYLE|nr:UNKNOWN [Stylonychia lemnae]|eukprot:CDW73298.1 UNKNOWN [Stylonychia lemnae]
MTVSTTINSFLLTFGPLIVTYQGLNLKQFNAYPACFFGAIAFLLTQIGKFIILAIAFPLIFPGDDFSEDDEQGSKFQVEHDVLRALVSCVDIVGLYFVLNAKRLMTIMGDLDVKIVAVGLGWSAAELVTSNFLDIIFQSWSNEMKSEYIMQALSANLDILEIIALTYLAYTLTKKEESSKKNLVYILVVLRYLMPVVLRYTKEQTKDVARECDLCYESMFIGAKAIFAGLLYLGSQKLK